MTVPTTNYGWIKPDVGSSDDVWGGLLNTDLDNIDSTVKSVSNAIPVASSTTPVMSGAGAVGAGTTWARADHQHPSDTSRYAATNPSGYQTAAQVTAAVPVASSTTPLMDGTAAIGVATTWARADHVHPTDTHAMGDNRIINGNFAINQRAYVSGTALATTVYGHDRWKAGPFGCTYTFTAALPDTTITITANTLTQVIEAGMIEGGVYTLSWTGTAQARVYQGTPTGSYAASPIVTASLTAGTNTIVEFNAGTVTRAKFEIGSIATPFNRQSMAKNLADCQRYYQKIGGDGTSSIFIQMQAGAVSQALGQTINYNAMRAAPTAASVGSPVLTGISAPSFLPGLQSMGIQIVSTATGSVGINYNTTSTYITLSAEL